MNKSSGKILTVSSFDKVFADGTPKYPESAYTIFSNEFFGFYVCTYLKSTAIMLRIEVDSDIKDRVSLRVVERVPAGFAKNPFMDDYYIENRGNNDLYPDVLRPYRPDGEIFVAGTWNMVMVTVDGRIDPLPIGEHIIKIRVYNTYDSSLWDRTDLECEYKLTVLSGKIPSHDLMITRWIHYDCICDKHCVEPFSDDFYRITEKYVKSAVSHGSNMLYVPLFTPSLDTAIGSYRRSVQLVKVKLSSGHYDFDFSELKNFLEFASSLGVKYFELSHLATQWGAEFAPQIVADVDGVTKRIFGWEDSVTDKRYITFLRAFLPRLKAFFDKYGYTDKVYFHISDEPSISALDRFCVIHDEVKNVFPSARFMDALSHKDFYDSGLIDYPFAGLSTYDEFQSQYVYYCGCMCKKYEPNCLLIMPLQRIRILGLLMFRNGIKGFLQWGLNYYHTAFSKNPIDPYAVTDGGGAFEAGDPFEVYPAKDDVYDSLRHEAFYFGLQDYALMLCLSDVIGREKAIKLLDDEGVKSGFYDYPRSAEWHSAFISRVRDLIIKYSKNK